LYKLFSTFFNCNGSTSLNISAYLILNIILK
jgi:hypothetical protein